MTGVITPALAVAAVQADSSKVIDEINRFTSSTFKTRGGRLGSGMGSLIEALWVYYMNTALGNEGGLAQGCELGWLQDHEPADFACLVRGSDWLPEARQGELFRIEAKSMNVGVEEAKGHFNNLAHETNADDQLLVVVWSWVSLGDKYFWPKIHDYFLGHSLPIIGIRDQLHIARGGSFVTRDACQDGCASVACTHDGEPLNAAGKRERRSGPKSCRPANVDYAANFGGLLRMLKTDNDSARAIFRSLRRKNDVVHRYISFIHKQYPNEELNHYRKSEWQTMLRYFKLDAGRLGAAELQALLRNTVPDYQESIREIF
jgi:hypothetical protein